MKIKQGYARVSEKQKKISAEKFRVLLFNILSEKLLQTFQLCEGKKREICYGKKYNLFT